MSLKLLTKEYLLCSVYSISLLLNASYSIEFTYPANSDFILRVHIKQRQFLVSYLYSSFTHLCYAFNISALKTTMLKLYHMMVNFTKIESRLTFNEIAFNANTKQFIN